MLVMTPQLLHVITLMRNIFLYFGSLNWSWKAIILKGTPTQIRKSPYMFVFK